MRILSKHISYAIKEIFGYEKDFVWMSISVNKHRISIQKHRNTSTYIEIDMHVPACISILTQIIAN